MLWDDDEPSFDPDSPYLPVFMPWLFHAWSPNPDETDIEDAALHEVPPTRAYLERKGARLSPLLREYLQSCLAQPFSFYEIERCDPGRGFSLRDVLTGEAFEVFERSGSQSLQAGELIYGSLASAQGVVLAEAMPLVAIPPIDKLEIIELRKRMQRVGGCVDRGSLREWDIELRELYLALSERLLHPQMPKLQTTDGEDLEFHKLVFDIDSARQAFDALKDLDILATEAELLEQADSNADGSLRRAEITWAKAGNRVHESWDNTILGYIEIEGSRLTAEVNSRERAEAFKAIVAGRLGGQARFRLDQVQSTEQMLARAPPLDPGRDARQQTLDDAPEVRAHVTKYLEQHYSAWVDTALPALAGRTPREAIADPDGREQVEALVRQMERDGRRQRPPADEAVFRRLRERLNLPVPA